MVLANDELKTALSYALMTPGVMTKTAAPATDDDEIDLFGDEPEDDAVKAKADRAAKAKAAKAEYDRKKALKPKKIEKSLVVLEVKPWEADTDLEMVWNTIKKYEQEGLVWGQNFQLEPIAFGVKKLVMTCTIEDDKVLMDDITDCIEALEDYVQSVQVASMNKI